MSRVLLAWHFSSGKLPDYSEWREQGPWALSWSNCTCLQIASFLHLHKCARYGNRVDQRTPPFSARFSIRKGILLGWQDHKNLNATAHFVLYGRGGGGETTRYLTMTCLPFIQLLKWNGIPPAARFQTLIRGQEVTCIARLSTFIQFLKRQWNSSSHTVSRTKFNSWTKIPAFRRTQGDTAREHPLTQTRGHCGETYTGTAVACYQSEIDFAAAGKSYCTGDAMTPAITKQLWSIWNLTPNQNQSTRQTFNLTKAVLIAFSQGKSRWWRWIWILEPRKKTCQA